MRQYAGDAVTALGAGSSDFPTAGARWHLRLLGGIRLQDHTTVHTRFATRAITALLARLALWPGRDHAREELIEILWPGVDVVTGRRRLRQALSLLKAALEPPEGASVPVLQADRLSVRVIPGTIACDVHAFLGLVGNGHREGALALYRGDLLPGFYDDWILEERSRLQALRDRLMAATAVHRDLHPTSAPAPQTAVPSMAGPTDALRPLRAHWPSYLTRYFDDAGQSERLLAQVLAHRLVTVRGPGGSGKTRLVVRMAEKLAPPAFASGPEGSSGFSIVLFVPLSAVQTREQLLGALRSALQIDDGAAPLDALLSRLEGVRALMVLDNAEQLAGVADELITSLTGALPGLHLLVTSRHRLGLDGEREFPVAALALPPSDAPLEVVAASPSVAMFVDRARAARVDFHLGDRNHRVIAELVRALEGMPLAIELAASRVRGFSPSEMLTRLRVPVAPSGATPRLDLLSRPGSRSMQQSRHTSMQRTIEWSWQQLDESQRAIAGALTVFPGGCDAPMLASVHPDVDIRSGLEHLYAHSLLRADAADPVVGEAADMAPRYQLYETIREYATAQFDPAHTSVWRARQRAWATGWLQAMPATPDLVQVRADQANLSLAFATAAADAAGDDVVALLVALRPLHEAVTWSLETLDHAAAALETATESARRSRGRSALVPLLFTAGRNDAATRQAEAAVREAPERTIARAWALQVLASVRWRGATSRAEQVMPWIDEAQALAQAHGGLDLLAALLSQRAYVQHGHDGDAEAASALHAQALALWEQLGNRHGVNYARYNLAVFDFLCGRRMNALVQWDAIAAEAALLQDWRRVSVVNSARSAALSEMRRWQEARQALRDGLVQSWRAMRLYDVAIDLWNLPRVLAHLRQPDKALALMAFAAQFWQSRFGALTPEDRRHIQRVERLAGGQTDVRARATATARGRQLSLAEAVALALAD